MKAVISDFGGVLTTPLIGAFEAMERESGLTLEELVNAMKALWERDGEHPMFELECGRITEAEFSRRITSELRSQGSLDVDLSNFSQAFFSGLEPNHEMIEFMRELAGTERRMALLTNNVREWEPYWRSMAPVDELFEIVIDSAYVDCRKPEPEIYHLTLEQLALEPRECLFIDDVEINCNAASELGIEVVHFQTTEQAVREIRSALGSPG